MKARLFARYGPERGREVVIGAEATIGRGRDNMVVLSSPEVSQKHARVWFDGASAAYFVEDLESLNGTRLDGVPLVGRERLGDMHVLSFGETAELFFVQLDASPEEPAERELGEPAEGTRVDSEAPTLPVGLRAPAPGEGTQADDLAPTLPVGLRSPAAPRPGTTTRVEEEPVGLPTSLAAGGDEAEEEGPAESGFVLVAGEPAPGRFPLGPGENLVGRAHGAAIRLRSRELSRRHATLRVEGDRVWVRDEGSRNHTFVGGRQIDAETEVEPGVELRFGLLATRLELAGPREGDD